GLIYSFKVLFFLGSDAVACFCFRHFLNLAVLFWFVKSFGKNFFVVWFLGCVPENGGVLEGGLS
ncbi:MAG: hypothetical protein ACKO11_00085, partial [Cuspidothrix sp.]